MQKTTTTTHYRYRKTTQTQQNRIAKQMYKHHQTSDKHINTTIAICRKKTSQKQANTPSTINTARNTHKRKTKKTGVTGGIFGNARTREPTSIRVLALRRVLAFSCVHARVKLVGVVFGKGGCGRFGRAAPVVPQGLPVFDPTPTSGLTLGR